MLGWKTRPPFKSNMEAWFQSKKQKLCFWKQFWLKNTERATFHCWNYCIIITYTIPNCYTIIVHYNNFSTIAQKLFCNYCWLRRFYNLFAKTHCKVKLQSHNCSKFLLQWRIVLNYTSIQHLFLQKYLCIFKKLHFI